MSDQFGHRNVLCNHFHGETRLLMENWSGFVEGMVKSALIIQHD